MRGKVGEGGGLQQASSADCAACAKVGYAAFALIWQAHCVPDYTLPPGHAQAACQCNASYLTQGFCRVPSWLTGPEAAKCETLSTLFGSDQVTYTEMFRAPLASALLDEMKAFGTRTHQEDMP
eukprot:6214283-Pleurochrysis_carterae.AAC.2